MAELSTKPYLIRAIHEWCTDSGYRPHIAVVVDERTLVPREFVRNGEIVLNVSAMATNRLRISNELIEFEARFGGVARQVSIPIDNVSAIYAQETGHGMAFDVPKALALVPATGDDATDRHDDDAEAAPQADAGAATRRGSRKAGGSRASSAGAGESGQSHDSGDSGEPRESDDALAEAGVERPRRRPKLSAVPSSPPAGAGEPAPAPKRRRKEPSAAADAQPTVRRAPRAARPLPEAVPSVPAPQRTPAGRAASPAGPGVSPAGAGAPPAGSGGSPAGDEAGGDEPRPPSGRPRLRRVK